MPEPQSLPPVEVSEFSAAAGTLFRPSETFAALVRKPTWWLPFVAGVLISAAFSFVMTDKVDLEASMRQAVEKKLARSGQTLPAAEMEKSVDRAVEMQRKMAPYYPTIGAVGYAFFFFVIVAVLAFAGNAFGAEAKFPVYLAAYSHAQIPLVIQSVYKTIRLVTSADSSLTFDQLGRVGAVGPALFFPASATGPAVSLALSLDLFLLWCVALAVVAFRKIPGLSRNAATTIPIAVWAVFVLIRIGLAALAG